MDWFIYSVLILLGALAVIDLFVGVSNDAGNFLNSAVGSRTAPFKVIMTVASLGVLLGATFSSGMMDVAKTGVIVPEYFSFYDVMVVFTAVMVTDVLLLNTFNSLGLPTSTTVSIVFELLGGATAMACYLVWKQGLPIGDLGQFVNSGKALAMIMAILISVILAFISGAIIQYLFRTVFTFKLYRTYTVFGGVFGGMSITAIFYFLVIKGAKGASFMHPEWIAWIDANTHMLLWSIFIGMTVILQALILTMHYNVFRLVILSGTFALAFAFAGNDLVNFVGVPLAALESATIFSESGAADATTFMMGGLRNSSHTPTFYLLSAGIVMVLTLWFSKKAHRVIRTSINLASTSRGGKEQFGSSMPARILVRSAIGVHDLIEQLIPQSVWAGVRKRFEPAPVDKSAPPVAFDELRASLNLVLAAALIANATSWKLPLSTTYVTFMVAMGSSLADGAWDRESAVYRITGVMTVISGWFITALSAFTACMINCALFILWGKYFMLVMMLVALGVVIKTNFLPKKKEAAAARFQPIEDVDSDDIKTILRKNIDRNLKYTLELFTDGMDAFLKQDLEALKDIKDRSVEFYDKTTQMRGRYYSMATARDGSKSDRDARNFYYRAFTSMKEVSHSLRDQIGVTENYVANSHSGFRGQMHENIEMLVFDLRQLKDDYSEDKCTKILARIEKAQADFMTLIGEEKISLRKSELYLGYFLFAREVINRYALVELLQRELEAGFKSEACVVDVTQVVR